jgi:iron(III) transport system substrate-binding protein
MRRFLLVVGLAAALVASACGVSEEEGPLTVYSGREEELVGPIIERFEKDTGIEVEVRYGDTAELAAQILEEGDNSPADVFWAQDAGALGAVAKEDRFAELPDATLDRVPERFRSTDGVWVGTSGRARVLAYNTEAVEADELPGSVLDLTDAKWKGRIGWAPTNGSFQAFVTALRKVEGEPEARTWLEGMEANDTKEFDGISAIVKAVAAGEIDAGLVNHYYVLEIGSEDAAVRDETANHFFEGGDVGSLVNVAGVGIIEGADAPHNAQRFVDYLLGRKAGQYFDEEVYEYPLVAGLDPAKGLPPLDDIAQPDVDLSDLDDLDGTLDLLRKAGVL